MALFAQLGWKLELCHGDQCELAKLELGDPRLKVTKILL
jgi:hypothetical protein